MDISIYLRRVARGKNGAEHLERDTAATVLGELMSPGADPLQLGAFLIAERMKGESSPELAGFVDAARRIVAGFGDHVAPQGAVDLPCYAGKRRAAPLHLAAALAARDAGIPVLVHGVEHIAGRISAWQALQAHDVRRAASLVGAAELLHGEGIAYIDLADVCPQLFSLIGLRPRLGVRSFAHTVARLLNPLNCAGQLNGVFHTPYVELMCRANAMLGQPRSLVFMGAEGDPELYAGRQKLLYAQQGGTVESLGFASRGDALYPRQVETEPERLLQELQVVLQGGGDERQQAVMQRMREAFAFASTGEMPAGWQAVVVQQQVTEVENEQ